MPRSDLQLEMCFENLKKHYDNCEFSLEEMKKNQSEWDEFFIQQGLGNEINKKIAYYIFDIIRTNIIQGSRNDQFYTEHYPISTPDRIPLIEKAIGDPKDVWGSLLFNKKAAALPAPKAWPHCIVDFSNSKSNIKEGSSDAYIGYTLSYDDPISIGMSYIKMSVFQLAVGNIAIELLNLFKTLYGEEVKAIPDWKVAKEYLVKVIKKDGEKAFEVLPNSEGFPLINSLTPSGMELGVSAGHRFFSRFWRVLNIETDVCNEPISFFRVSHPESPLYYEIEIKHKYNPPLDIKNFKVGDEFVIRLC